MSILVQRFKLFSVQLRSVLTSPHLTSPTHESSDAADLLVIESRKNQGMEIRAPAREISSKNMALIRMSFYQNLFRSQGGKKNLKILRLQSRSHRRELIAPGQLISYFRFLEELPEGKSYSLPKVWMFDQ